MKFKVDTVFSDDDVSRMILHLFLPRKLPGFTAKHLVQDEANLLLILRDCIAETHKASKNFCLPQAVKLFNTWTYLQCQELLDADHIAQKIASLEPGDAVALYIRAQNCGFLLSVPNDQYHDPTTAVLSTFPASQKSEDVMSKVGDLSAAFPSSSIHIPITHFLKSNTFGRQLSDLCYRQYDLAMPHTHRFASMQTEVRDVADPLLISKLITASLTDQTSEVCVHFTKIFKTIRDHVNWNDSLLPFRRSGLWTTAKVILHLSLVNTFGKSNGTFMYKMIILRLLACCCERSSHATADIRTQMLTKIARRVCKLEKYSGHISEQFIKMYSELRLLVRETVKLVRDQLDREWMQIVEMDIGESTLPKLAGLNFSEDTAHVNCTTKLYQFHKMAHNRAEGGKMLPPNFPLRYRVYDTTEFSPSHFDVVGEENLSIALWDFEQFVLTKLDGYADVYNCQKIRQLFEKYIEVGGKFYGKDPVGSSQMILLSLKILQALDRITIAAHPVLGEHKSGVDIGIIKDLLLPQHADMKLAQQLELYFAERNTSNFPSLIAGGKASKSSLAVRFASLDYRMKDKLDEILEYSKDRIQLKLMEVQHARRHCQDLRSEAEMLPHQYLEEEDMYGIVQQKHSEGCHKCSLVKQANNTQVELYECPLPEPLHEQYAVVFELLILNEIACLRDALYFFAKNVCCMICPGGVEIKVQWTKYSELAKHRNGYQHYVQLGSTIKAFTSTHYRSQHPEKYTDYQFIVDNGLNCFYEVDLHCMKAPVAATIKHYCTFNTDQDHQYKSLSWTVEDTYHTQNEVLARQDTCHKEMSLLEFIDFGSLRAGHRLQLRNIYKSLNQGTLSFHKEPVFSLICQSVWQAGPPLPHMCVCREAQEDLLDPIFAGKLIDLLKKVLHEQSENWTNYYTFFTILILTSRILTFAASAQIETQALELILKCRRIAVEWARKVEEVLSKMTEKSKKKIEELRCIIIFINACSALTFWVDSKYIHSILNCSMALKCWLHAIATIKDNVTLSVSSIELLSIPLRNLLRWVRDTGLALEKHLHAMLQRDTNGLQEFTKDHWAGSRTAKIGEWTSCGNSNTQVYTCECTDRHGYKVVLHMDIICGNFLVNGCPVGYLPEAITNHPEYQRVFSNTVFEVQPVTGQHCTLVTRLKYHKCDYLFSLNNQMLTVTETIENKGEKVVHQLIPCQLFIGVLPHLLIHEHSHWWNKTRNVVVFCPKSFSNPEFGIDVRYSLDLTTHRLLYVATQNAILDINSKSFIEICKVMKRLESPMFILAFYSQDGKTIVALPRMGLHFEIDLNNSNEVRPREYPEMKVCSTQKFGTLVGLKQGLLLESVDSDTHSNRILLMPHGKLTIQTRDSHQQVEIKLDELRKPEFFTFEVDDRLCQLRAGQSRIGWMFLTYLHAVTASPLPDPFTHFTGTETALRLLNSPHCWSCQPLGEKEFQTLGEIACLSPKRKYYPPKPKCMEKVQWPQGLSAVGAHDCYREIVKELFQNSERLVFLGFTKPQNITLQEDAEAILVSKALWHHRPVCPELGLEYPGSCSPLEQAPKPIFVTPFCRNLDSKVMQSVRTMAHLGHTWSSVLPLPVSGGHLKPLLVAENTLLMGVSGRTFHTLDTSDILEMDFKNSWLNLYNFARDVTANHYECQWTMLLSVFAFNSVSSEHLMYLHAVAVHAEEFENISPPQYKEYPHVSENGFNAGTVKSIFEQHKVPFEYYLKQTGQQRKYLETVENFMIREMKIKHQYAAMVADQVYELTEIVKYAWPTMKCDSFLACSQKFQQIRLESAVTDLTAILTRWYQNRELALFLQRVESAINKLRRSQAVALTQRLTQSDILPVENQLKNKQFFEFDLFDILKDGTKSTQLYDSFIKLDNVLLLNAEQIYKNGYLCYAAKHVAFPSDSKARSEPFPWKTTSDCEIGTSYMKDNENSWNMYEKQSSKKVILTTQSQELCRQLKNDCLYFAERAAEAWQHTVNHIKAMCRFQFEVLRCARLLPKIAPISLLPLICDRRVKKHIQNLIGATAVLWTLEQRANRCLKFTKAGESMKVDLMKELSNRGHENWSPQEKPKWLLLELEMDMMIRPVQVEVANAMLQPQDNEHAVMQLNMGEGKTAVIIPMVVAQLANGEQLCRVTVLKSLFQMNRDALAFRMGGLLNQRVYTLPCRRDMIIGSCEADTMISVYKECVKNHGFVLSLPEHRLSFQLKGYEMSRNKKYADAHSLLAAQQWLNNNTRDILDESDEILHVKYQLVYTIGGQVFPGGGPLRWTVAQNLLELLPPRLCDIIQNYGEDAAECDYSMNAAERFPHCRLLKVNHYVELCSMLVKDIMDGKLSMSFPDLPAEQRYPVTKFLICATISEKEHKVIMNILNSNMNTTHCDVLLILRGLLACGVLSLVLTKRWRVNYGVSPNGHRLMAVPFRAKDVAAERIEFGHPDMAILCTILSYYYSGLSNAQLDQCFDYLYRQKNGDQEYKVWASKIPNAHPSIKTLSGINLRDFEQKEKLLYPALLKNPAVINFFLGTIVFPKESKQFESKMSCSPWDLCSDEFKKPVTGFSGTNDTKLLLPLNIYQRDLPSLCGTNGKVLYNLLQPENGNYVSLPPGTSSNDILEQLVRENIPLLLDVGALMTDFDNKTVAREWLKLIPESKKEAAIYFDKADKLVVTDKENRTSLFELSPFRRRMEKCVTYLDDFHTRGTDLKFPSGTKGCVTLGKGVTKDKLVQGCMRMRMLGEGHTVCFWSSQEVNNEIMQLCGVTKQKIHTKEVLDWAMENSRLATRDVFLHWAVAGFNFSKKKMAHLLFDRSLKTDDNILKLGERCADKEVISLMKMYGSFRTEDLYPNIARDCLEDIKGQFKLSTVESRRHGNVDDVISILNQCGEKIVQQCQHYVPNLKRLSYLLDEEQERELEHELEKECEFDRPPHATPAEHILDENVRNFIAEGILPDTDENTWSMRLPQALQKTKLSPSVVQAESWGHDIFATNDFSQVVTVWNSKDSADQFLRPLNWVAAVTKDDVTTLLLLSPFEVNELMPEFRSKAATAVLHMFAARLNDGQDTLIRCPQLAVPSSTSTPNYLNFDILCANLALFGGNLYFENKHEQDVYTSFLGFILRPRTYQEQFIFDKGWTTNGFVLPAYRMLLPYIQSEFQHNPDQLVRDIIDRRIEHFPDQCHIHDVIVEAIKPFQ